MFKSIMIKTVTLISLFLYLFASTGFIQNSESSSFDYGLLKFFPQIPVSNQIPISIAEAEIGRHLFYDPILSRDSSFSCASCHQQKFAFSDNVPFSSGIDSIKTNRNTMPLYNLIWYENYFWDGRANSLENQVFEPLQKHSEMDLSWTEAARRVSQSDFYSKLIKQEFGNIVIDSFIISKLIAQFERTLISQDSKFDQVLKGEKFLSEQEKLGFELMNDQTKGKCLHCHTTDINSLGTIVDFKNNGLDSALNRRSFSDFGLGGITKKDEDYGKFKIPSIRNLGFTAPYMHDGRFNSLMEVLDFYDNPNFSITIDSKVEHHLGGANLNLNEKKAIIAFLNSLNDSLFISRNDIANPFK